MKKNDTTNTYRENKINWSENTIIWPHSRRSLLIMNVVFIGLPIITINIFWLYGVLMQTVPIYFLIFVTFFDLFMWYMLKDVVKIPFEDSEIIEELIE